MKKSIDSQKNPWYRTRQGIIVISVAAIIVLVIVISGSKSNNSSLNQQAPTSASAEEKKRIAEKAKEDLKEQIADLETNAITMPYKDLYRDIEANKGKKVHYKGKVVQVIDGYIAQYRVNITEDKYGYWNDTVLISDVGKTLDSEQHPKILDEDIIEFWGTVLGEASYESTIGAKISLPEITVQKIELK